MFEPIFLGLLLGVPLSVQIALTFGKQNMVCFQKKNNCPGGKASSAQPAILHRHSLGYVVVFHGDTPIAGWCLVENPIRMNDLGLLPFLDTSLYLDFFICLGYVGFDTYNSWLTCGN